VCRRAPTLPAAASNTGRIFVVKRIDTGACDVAPVAALDGGPTVTLSAGVGNRGSVTVQSDGSTWWVIGQAQ